MTKKGRDKFETSCGSWKTTLVLWTCSVHDNAIFLDEGKRNNNNYPYIFSIYIESCLGGCSSIFIHTTECRGRLNIRLKYDVGGMRFTNVADPSDALSRLSAQGGMYNLVDDRTVDDIQ